MAVKTLKFKIKGTAPLLMNSPKCVDPTHPLNALAKKITAKKKKTDEDYEELARIGYMKAIFHDDKIGCYFPANCIEAAICAGARKVKLGKSANAAVFVNPDMIPLIYEGPRSIEDLYADPRFRDVRNVKVGQARVMRIRPRFEQWALQFEVQFEDTLLDPEDIRTFLADSGQFGGMGDFRPKYGRFSVLEL